ncbi:zinc finger MYM-type protein 1-like [Ylistrum balloti]|uniref:zinc finger MYM-type protein 1-like n=1 Tax=Ylistrum balloti TaxID=509963 RepID=UPI002905CD1D|nr:zinc finger MYM-type protein 1-like [Ylistrum balloti]
MLRIPGISLAVLSRYCYYVADKILPFVVILRKSNFIATLTMLSKGDVILENHLKNPNVVYKYTSSDIQNELLDICAAQIVRKISESIQRSRYFAVLADECTDTATKEQLSICIRYLVYEGPLVSVREDFLCFVTAENTKGQTIAVLILDVLQQNGFDINKLRAQGYDGAANMSGKFKNDLATNENARYEMEKRTKLRTLCETRWSSRADALKTFKASLSVVVSSLDHLKDDGDDKAGGRLCAILRFEFIIGLVVAEHILSSTVSLSNYLQTPKCNLLQALKESKVIIQLLRNERADDTVWDALYDEAVTIAAEFYITPSTLRRAGIQRQRANPVVNNTKDYWKVTLYLAFLDHLITELEIRLVDSEGRFKGEALLPEKLDTHLNAEMIQAIYDANTYDADLTDPDTFRQEIERWKARWSMVPTDERPADIITCLNHTDPQLYPNITNIPSLLLAMPVTTATAERSFSSMKRVKTYLRSTMTTERLASLATLNIHREQEVDICRAVETFANAKSGKRLAHFI